MSESRVANGTIKPSRFVYIDSTTPGGRVLQATGVTNPLFGISQTGTRNAPYPSLDDGNAALVNENIGVYTFADKECWLELGVGGCNAGDYLTADANGAGVVTTTTGNFVCAKAKQSGVQGDLVPVDLLSPSEF